MTELLIAVMSLVGVGLIVTGVALISTPAAFIVAGVLILVASVNVARTDRPAVVPVGDL